MNFPTLRIQSRGAKDKHAVPADRGLNAPKDRGFQVTEPMDVDPDATTPGKLRSRVLVSSKTVRFKRNPNGGDGLGNFISVKLDQYFISGVDGDGNIFDDVAYFGVEVGNQPEEADPEVKVEPTQRIMEHVALVDFQGQTYVVLTHKKIK